MFQVSINSIQSIRIIVRKQNFNQNFNLIVDAARPVAILTNANLLAEIFRWKIRLKTFYIKQMLSPSLVSLLTISFSSPSLSLSLTIRQIVLH